MKIWESSVEFVELTGEELVSVIEIKNFNENMYVVLLSRQGQGKSPLKRF